MTKPSDRSFTYTTHSFDGSMRHERRQHLQDLDQLTETTTARSKRRAEWTSTTGTAGTAAAAASSSSVNDEGGQEMDKLDLREASLEMLEDLIAQSAERLANYRLRRQSDQVSVHSNNNSSVDLRLDTNTPKIPENSLFTSPMPTTTHQETSRSNSSNSNSNSNSSATSHSSTHLAQSPPNNPQNHKNYKNHKNNDKRALPASMSSHHILDKHTFSLVSPTKSASSRQWLRQPTSTTSHPRAAAATTAMSSSFSSNNLRKSMSPPSADHGRRLRTLSTLDTLSPRLTKPTMASLSKSTKKDHNDTSILSTSSSSTSLANHDATPSPSIQPKRRSRHVSMVSKPTSSSSSSSMALATSSTAITTPSVSVRARTKENRVSQRLSQPQKVTIKDNANVTTSKSTVSTSSQRKRGKTLPGSLATPPTSMPLTLPPMKVEPLSTKDANSSRNMTTATMANQAALSQSRSTAKTPTRIPIPSSKSSKLVAGSASTTSHHVDDPPTAKIAAGTTVYSSSSSSYMAPPGMKQRHAHLKKQGSAVSLRSSASQTTSTSASHHATHATSSSHTASHPHSSIDLLAHESAAIKNKIRTRKISTISTRTGMGVSASLALPEKSSDPRRNRIPTLHERLQALVNENNQWRGSTRTQSSTLGPLHAKHATTTASTGTKDKVVTIRGGGAPGATHGATQQPIFAGEDVFMDEDGNSEALEQENTCPLRYQGKPNQGMTPEASLERCAAYLTSHEQKEILAYDRVYFLGQPSCGKLQQQQTDTNYDDERGDYRVVLRDHLAFRYEILAILGKGSFGQVLKCFDHCSGQTVAVKLIRNKKRFHTQALVEINILQQLIHWDPHDKHHNIRMKDHFLFRHHLCITFECLSINLYDFIKTNNFQGFSLGLIQRFTIQILQSLALLHKHRLIHCDLKPENILLKNPKKSGIKVIDFGSSCMEHEKVYTYIQSRFYRSPEVILGMNYSMAIDMWSVGCILGELFSGYPLFPGENEQEQLACIMEVLDVPPPSLIMASSRRKLFFDSQCQPRIVANSKGKKRYPNTKTIQYLLSRKKTLLTRDHTLDLFLDFIHQCLKWDPDERMTPAQALQHEWILSMKK